MALSEQQKLNLHALDIETKAEIIQEIEDEFMSVSQYSACSGMAERTVYDNFGKKVKGFLFCGFKITYF